MPSRFIILGIHGREVFSVNEYDANGRLIKERNVARVRMYVNGKEFDEDFDLPKLPLGVQENQQVYQGFLQEQIENRMKELEAQNV